MPGVGAMVAVDPKLLAVFPLIDCEPKLLGAGEPKPPVLPKPPDCGWPNAGVPPANPVPGACNQPNNDIFSNNNQPLAPSGY